MGGIGKELECNNIDSYRYRRKGSLLIQTLYLRDRDRERGKKKPKISHSTFDRKINLIDFVPFVQWSNSTGSNLWDLRNDIKKKRGKKKFILNKNEVEEPRFQMNKFKLEKDLSDSRRMRGRGIDRERSLVLIIGS